ncbi:MAG: hypothetical protein KQJ78_20385 [Deltaproteobacteria bacterium]|nr:hypothetical protein [Deltaproteobacteria bacterium]
MLDLGQFDRLIQTETFPHDTLSVYLSLDHARDRRLLALGDLVKKKEGEMSGNGSAEAWQKLEEDCQQIAKYVEDLSSSPGRGLALFSCARTGMFEAVNLEITITNLLAVGPKPYIRPLAALAGDLSRTVTVLLDKKQARFFVSFMGVAEEKEDMAITNEAESLERPGDQGRTGDNQMSRRADEALGRHFKEVTATLKELMEASQAQHLLVGGAKGAVEAFVGGLSGSLAGKLHATFALDAQASLSELSQTIREVQTAARRQLQEKILAALTENLGAGGKYTAGLNEVLACLYDGKVHILLVSRDFTSPGGVCPSCGRLRHVAGPCPLCNEPMTKVQDVVDLAVAQAMRSGAQIEQVSGPSALDHMGGVAAVLRYA